MRKLSVPSQRTAWSKGRGAWVFIGILFALVALQVSAQDNKRETAIEKNKSLVRAFFNAAESGDYGPNFDMIVAEDYHDHLNGQKPGRDNLKAYLRAVRAAFPDMKWPVHQMVAEGDYVVVFNGFEATHQGDFGPYKATGKRVQMDAFQLYKIVNGKLAEHWEIPDLVTLQQQLESR